MSCPRRVRAMRMQCFTARRKRCQQPETAPGDGRPAGSANYGQATHPFLKHAVTLLQVINEHPVGQEVAEDADLALCFLVLGFLALGFCASCFGAVCADGAGVASPAQAGTIIRANNNSSMFFMEILFHCGF